MRSGNPALNDKTFLDVGSGRVVSRDDAMSLGGTVNKTALLLAILVTAAAYAWGQFSPADPGRVMPWMWGGAIGGLVVALVLAFKKEWAPVGAPLYAVAEGLFVGGI